MSLPFVSVCTPTFNRRPFYEMTIQCFQNQTYPKDRMEWIIVDDGTDKIEDLVSHLPCVKYFKYDERMKLGKKRNVMHEHVQGDIIVYMDDDDYYPPDRVSHAVEMLMKNPSCMVAGSSELYLYFKHINEMYQCGPYGPNHATAATFAFRREYMKSSAYDDTATLAEEKQFLQNYSAPMIQLDPMKTILVFSHIHNSLDKRKLLAFGPNAFMKPSDKRVGDFVKEEALRSFFLERIDALLDAYEPGRPEHKPDVLEKIKEIEEIRMRKIEEHRKNTQLVPLTPEIIQELYKKGATPEMIQQLHLQGGVPVQQGQQQQQQERDNALLQQYESRFQQQQTLINSLIKDKTKLENKVEYLETKIKALIDKQISEIKKRQKTHI